MFDCWLWIFEYLVFWRRFKKGTIFDII